MMAALRRERRRLYNRPVVRLRRSVLSALADLVRDPLLLRDEAFSVSGGGARKRTVALASFFQPLVALLRALVDASPVQLACVYDRDGNPLRYEPRPHAADYAATPSGDMLLKLPEPNEGDLIETEVRPD